MHIRAKKMTQLGSRFIIVTTTLQHLKAESGSRLSLPLAPLSLHQPVRKVYFLDYIKCRLDFKYNFTFAAYILSPFTIDRVWRISICIFYFQIAVFAGGIIDSPFLKESIFSIWFNYDFKLKLSLIFDFGFYFFSVICSIKRRYSKINSNQSVLFIQ
jgi:hypothetical protein